MVLSYVDDVLLPVPIWLAVRLPPEVLAATAWSAAGPLSQ
jgi:hypothetical protein